jgi:hypothetical protein
MQLIVINTKLLCSNAGAPNSNVSSHAAVQLRLSQPPSECTTVTFINQCTTNVLCDELAK